MSSPNDMKKIQLLLSYYLPSQLFVLYNLRKRGRLFGSITCLLVPITLVCAGFFGFSLFGKNCKLNRDGEYTLPVFLNLGKIFDKQFTIDQHVLHKLLQLYPHSILALYHYRNARCSNRPFRNHIIETFKDFGNRNQLSELKVVQFASQRHTLTVQLSVKHVEIIYEQILIFKFIKHISYQFSSVLIVSTHENGLRRDVDQLISYLRSEGKTVSLHISHEKLATDEDLRAFIFHRARNIVISGGMEGVLAALSSTAPDGIFASVGFNKFLKVNEFRHALGVIKGDQSNSVLEGMGKVVPTCCKFSSFGKGDSEKVFCSNAKGYMKEPCWILSLGCKNQWGFETEVFKSTKCFIQVFDCTGNFKVPTKLKTRTTVHKICVGLQNDTRKTYLSWEEIIEVGSKASGFEKGIPPVLAKMDVEGWEYPVLTALSNGKNDVNVLPKQIEFELHVLTHINVGKPWVQLSPTRYRVDLSDVQYLVGNLSKIGYQLVHRADNPFCGHCSEVTFLHQSVLPEIE